MTDQHLLNIDLMRPTSFRWSFHAAEVPYTNGNNERSHHSFLLLVDDASDAILDELHFKPQECAGDHRPLLGAEAYTNPDRSLYDIVTMPYDDGSPREMLRLWNAVLRGGQKVSDMGRHFELLDCRNAVRAVVESLGYHFHTFPDLGVKLCPDRGLKAALGPLVMDACPDDATLQQDYVMLRQQLNARSGLVLPSRMRDIGVQSEPANDIGDPK